MTSMTPDNSASLLSAQITVRYPSKAPVLRGISLEIARGEVLGLVGQSGSGKSTLALAILGLLGRQRAIVEGSIIFQGVDLLTMRERELRNLRGRSLSLVLQSPLASLNPALLIADEATSALDVITQAEILELFARLNREIGMSILYISHDLPSVAGIC